MNAFTDILWESKQFSSILNVIFLYFWLLFKSSFIPDSTSFIRISNILSSRTTFLSPEKKEFSSLKESNGKVNTDSRKKWRKTSCVDVMRCVCYVWNVFDQLFFFPFFLSLSLSPSSSFFSSDILTHLYALCARLHFVVHIHTLHMDELCLKKNLFSSKHSLFHIHNSHKHGHHVFLLLVLPRPFCDSDYIAVTYYARALKSQAARQKRLCFIYSTQPP